MQVFGPVISLAALLVGVGMACAAPSALPLAAHRAAYEITLESAGGRGPSNGQAPVAAAGLIAYEFTGSVCEGYASNFRQVTELQRNEGDPISSDVSSVTFEDGDGKTMKFEIESHSSSAEDPPIAGSAAHGAEGGALIELYKPQKTRLNVGGEILFPTQHLEKIIAAAKTGGRTVQARVYDGSDTGRKVFVTLAVIGAPATTPSPDAAAWPALAESRRWPVTVSYFDEALKDGPADYTLSYDLYENGVTGSLKLDYGAFVLNAKLSKLEWLKSAPCGK